MTKLCAKCRRPLYKRNTSGLCKMHFNTDPAWVRRRAQGQVRNMTPARRAEARARILAVMSSPAEIARRADPAERKRVAARRVAAQMAWCPLEYREAYSALRGKDGITAAEARQLILDQIEVDRARFLRTGKLQQSVRSQA